MYLANSRLGFRTPLQTIVFHRDLYARKAETYIWSLQWHNFLLILTRPYKTYESVASIKNSSERKADFRFDVNLQTKGLLTETKN